MKEAEKQYRSETERCLRSSDKKIVLSRLRELRTTGNASLLPLILDLLSMVSDEDIVQNVLGMLGELRDQNCSSVMAKYIDDHPAHAHRSQIIASCWQSRLDYSEHLCTFTNSFITGDYQTAIESFTVIEESLWKSDASAVGECLVELKSRKQEIVASKMPLYNELIHTLQNKRTPNAEEYPDLYPDPEH